MTKPVCLIIRDGYGLNENPKGNAVLAAETPNTDALKAAYPWTTLDCSGEPVGLPDGYQGSSEVGHLNMGAGRIVVQELKRIDDGLSTGALFEKPKWTEFMKTWTANQSRLHLFGLLQDEGVHAHQEHLFKIMHRARQENPEGAIIIHPFLDGRDTPPRSCEEYIAKLKKVMVEVGNCTIGTTMGRYFGMDRGQTWPLTDQAYACIVDGAGRTAEDMEAAVKEAYENDKTPDGGEMVDEYIPCYAMEGYTGVQDGDVLMHTNYRQDRAIQLTMAFLNDDYPGVRDRRPAITYLGLTQYYDEFTEYLLEPMSGAGGGMEKLLGEIIGAAGLKQLRIAETQKFRHVTSFFNGKSTTPYPGEDQVEVKGRFDPATFADHPEMEAYQVTEEILKRIEDDAYSFIAVNLANGDMVGHTGNFDAATKAIEVVDDCVGKLVDAMIAKGYRILITADHGNSDQMIDYETGRTKTSHTLHPVEMIYVGPDAPGTKLLGRGKLSDLAPTILYLLGLEIPTEMTAENLICAAPTCCGNKGKCCG